MEVEDPNEKYEELKRKRDIQLGLLQIYGMLSGAIEPKIIKVECDIVDKVQDITDLITKSTTEEDKEQILAFLIDVNKQVTEFYNGFKGFKGFNNIKK